MGIVHQETEFKFFFEGHHLIQGPQGPGHPKNPLGYHQDAPQMALFLNNTAGPHQLGPQTGHIVVFVNKTLARMQSHPVHNASMGFGIVNNDIVAIHQGVNRRNHGLVTVIHQQTGLFTDIMRQFTL